MNERLVRKTLGSMLLTLSASTLVVARGARAQVPTPTLTPEQQRIELTRKLLSSTIATPTPALFGTATCGGVAARTMIAGQILTSGQQILSPNGKYRLRYQPDANLVLYLGTSTTVVGPRPPA